MSEGRRGQESCDCCILAIPSFLAKQAMGESTSYMDMGPSSLFGSCAVLSFEGLCPFESKTSFICSKEPKHKNQVAKDDMAL